MTGRDAERGLWVAGGVGVVGCVVGWIVVPAQFPHAWLAALTFWIGWPLGSMALILIHALTGGRWGWAIRAPLVAGVMTLPLLLPALLPILVVLHALYPWMHPDVAAGLSNRFYLNPPFFYGRGVLYLVVWFGLGALVLRALRRDDADAALFRIAPPGLILLALTITFAAFDYTLSMEPRFKSSVYGLLVGTEGVLFALSIAVLWAALLPGAQSGPATEDLGKLMLGLLVFWAYLDFVQLLIIWQSDLTHEAEWYVRRITGGWSIVAAIVAGLHFVLPFFALLWPQVQRSRRGLAVIAAMLVAIEVPRAWWLVIPDSGHGLSLLDVAAMLAVLGLSAALAMLASRMLPEAASVVRHG